MTCEDDGIVYHGSIFHCKNCHWLSTYDSECTPVEKDCPVCRATQEANLAPPSEER